MPKMHDGLYNSIYNLRLSHFTALWQSQARALKEELLNAGLTLATIQKYTKRVVETPRRIGMKTVEDVQRLELAAKRQQALASGEDIQDELFEFDDSNNRSRKSLISRNRTEAQGIIRPFRMGMALDQGMEFSRSPGSSGNGSSAPGASSHGFSAHGPRDLGGIMASGTMGSAPNGGGASADGASAGGRSVHSRINGNSTPGGRGGFALLTRASLLTTNSAKGSAAKNRLGKSGAGSGH